MVILEQKKASEKSVSTQGHLNMHAGIKPVSCRYCDARLVKMLQNIDASNYVLEVLTEDCSGTKTSQTAWLMRKKCTGMCTRRGGRIQNSVQSMSAGVVSQK